jgi:hypothetical protein
MENTLSDANPEGIPIKGVFALSFLLTFYSAVFMADINRTLRPILIDGNFYKKEDRTEFTESYNNLIKLEDDIRKLEQDIAPSGDFGKRYIQARQDISSLPVKRRKIQIVIEEASNAAMKILKQTRIASINMINILNGILEKDTTGKYDTLINMSKLVGKGDRFVTGINETIQQFQKVLQILDEIEAMEAGR